MPNFCITSKGNGAVGEQAPGRQSIMAKRKAKRGRGRPELPANERKSSVLVIRLTKEERALVEKAAGGNVSRWARDALLQAARRCGKLEGE